MRRRRSGFTLVEVLVSMALILFIMSILAAAFTAATQAVSDFKAAGDLAEKLRGASVVLRRDLEADHFTDGSQTSVRLSDPNFWGRLSASAPPVGFFRIYQQTPDVSEGVDLDGIPSFYQPSTVLHYSIALHGIRRSDFLSAAIPAVSPLTTPQSPTPSTSDMLLGPPDQRYQDTLNVPNESIYSSQLAEVVVFLAPNGDQTDGTSGPARPLMSLCRRQFLAVPTGWTSPPLGGNPPPPPATQAPSYLEVSTIPGAPETAVPPAAAGNLTFNDMLALTMPIRRFSMDRTSPNRAAGVYGAYLPTAGQYATMAQSNGGFQSADLLLSDVVSFDVRVLLKGAPDFVDLCNPSLAPYFSGNPAFNQQTGPIAFDTWSNQTDALTGVSYANWATPGTLTSVPLFQSGGPTGSTISIQAIQITLRVWDFKTKKTRQVTIVQQM